MGEELVVTPSLQVEPGSQDSPAVAGPDREPQKLPLRMYCPMGAGRPGPLVGVTGKMGIAPSMVGVGVSFSLGTPETGGT